MNDEVSNLTAEELKLQFDLALSEYKSVQAQYEKIAYEMKEARNCISLVKRFHLDESKAFKEYNDAVEAFLIIEKKLNRARKLSRKALEQLENL